MQVRFEIPRLHHLTRFTDRVPCRRSVSLSKRQPAKRLMVRNGQSRFRSGASRTQAFVLSAQSGRGANESSHPGDDTTRSRTDFQARERRLENSYERLMSMMARSFADRAATGRSHAGFPVRREEPRTSRLDPKHAHK